MAPANKDTHFKFQNDGPVDNDEQDFLDYGPVAEHIAQAVCEQVSDDGVVVGLEGAWGCGKTSLLELTLQKIATHIDDGSPIIVRFQPWLIGDRDALLSSFFDDLVAAIAEAAKASDDPDPLKDLSELVRGFGRSVSKLAPLAKVLSEAGVPGGGVLGAILKFAGKVSEDTATLQDRKKAIDDTLLQIDHQIIVTIDDVDRLEPAEIAEVLRLVRSVADFKKATYILCYDPEIVSPAIERAMSVHSGLGYLEKIVQLAIRIPAPESFALRRMFSEGLASFTHMPAPDIHGVEGRLAAIIDHDGGRALKTPRAVNRTLDSLRFWWKALEGKVDLADLVWLQLIRASEPELYLWVETYLTSVAAVVLGHAHVTDEEKRKSFNKLKKIYLRSDVDLNRELYRLDDVLPGIRSFTPGSEEIPIFQNDSDEQIAEAIASKRLASPDHYRLYFALKPAAGSVQPEDLHDLWASAKKDKSALEDLFRSWLEQTVLGSVTKLEIVLDRIRNLRQVEIAQQTAENILWALADMLDADGAAQQRHEPRWAGGCWREAKKMLPLLRDALGDKANEVLIAMFRGGSALGWLTDIFREETFAHNLYGDRPQPSEDWILNEAVFSEVVPVMQARYNSLSLQELLALPHPLNALYAWLQSGDAERVRLRFAEFTSDDVGLLEVVSAFSGRVYSSGGNYYKIEKSDLDQFGVADEIIARLTLLSSGESKHAQQAEELLRRIENSRY